MKLQLSTQRSLTRECTHLSSLCNTHDFRMLKLGEQYSFNPAHHLNMGHADTQTTATSGGAQHEQDDEDAHLIPIVVEDPCLDMLLG